MTAPDPEWEEQQRLAREAQERRTLSLRSRGWQRPVPYDRNDLQEWTLDRWVLRNEARRVQ